jgi:hypothetical protein
MQDLPVIGKVAERAASAAGCPGWTDFDCAHAPAALDPAQPCAARVGSLGRVRGTA